VKIIGLSFDPEFDSLDVYFDKNTWDVGKDGLIYTDNQFLNELQFWLYSNYPYTDWNRLQYTEQGMQTKDYVSLELV
jgi:hypothetical protein